MERVKLLIIIDNLHCRLNGIKVQRLTLNFENEARILKD